MSLRVYVYALVCLLASIPSAFAQTTTPAGTLSTDTWLDRVNVFAGLEGSKQPQDLGINANMGARFAVNVGAPIVRSAGFGVQLGAAVNLSDAAVHVLDQVEGTSSRTQTFTTVGVFQRTSRLSWAFAFDAQQQSYYDDVWMSQVRGEAYAALGAKDQLGVWFTVPVRETDASVAGTPLLLAPIGQANVTARHSWASGARTGLWVGVASGHHNVVLVFPDNSSSGPVVVYGADLWMPLNDRWAITGAANLMTPTSTGTVDAFMGVTFNLGRGRASSFSPMMGVANNTSFSVDLSRP